MSPHVETSPLVDTFGRVHTDLRISVTDRCNIRCTYCMPAENVQFLPRDQILSFEEIERFVRVVARMGVDRIRLTGGEPLVRADLDELITRLRAIDSIGDIALTTNGILLAPVAVRLRQAGLTRMNISLDTLDPQKFEQLTRRKMLDRVLEGIDAAVAAGFERLRLNAIAIRGQTESEVVPLVRFARERGLELRFIEYMPLDADHAWQSGHVLSGDELRELVEAEFGTLIPAPRPDPSQPAVDFEFAEGSGSIGFIHPVSQPFCGDCNRLRLTAEGQVRNCLFSTTEWDARALMRGGGSDSELAALVRSAVVGKRAGHGIDTEGFVRPERAMYQIGG